MSTVDATLPNKHWARPRFPESGAASEVRAGLQSIRNKRRGLARLLVALLAILFFSFGIAHAQTKLEEDVHKFKEDVQKFQQDVHKKVQSLIEQLRHGDTPEGIAKTNGRIEATEIDVAPKYAGRLESVDVEEGDEVKAGQVVARISSPEYEAQLRNAQANVLVAKSAMASAVAKVAQAKADLVFAEADLERGKALVKQGWLTKQMFDQRLDKAEREAR